MDLFTLIKVVLSRWRVVIPIAVLTLGIAYLVQTTTPPEYQANGFLVLESPELDAEATTSTVIDPAQIALAVELEGDLTGRNFTVTPLGGNNYSVQAVGPTAEQAEDDAIVVVNRVSQRITNLQEQGEVPPAERVDLRLVDPAIVAEAQPDESFLASATVFLNDPAMSTTNPYLANASTGRLLEVAFLGDAAQAEFTQRTGGGVTAQVGQEARDAAPLLQVLTTGSDPEAVIEGFYVTQDIMAEDLRARQQRANVLPTAMLTLGVLDAPLGVTDESPPVERAAAGIVVLGGLLALAAALGLEALSRHRRPSTRSLRDLVTPADDTSVDHAPAVGPDPDPRSTVPRDHGAAVTTGGTGERNGRRVRTLADRFDDADGGPSRRTAVGSRDRATDGAADDRVGHVRTSGLDR